MGHGKFATAINCMDGRTQIPVNEFLRAKYGVDYVDTITEPGPIKFLSENKDEATIASIKSRVHISVAKHGSRYIALVGHYDCAGNPVDRETQRIQTLESAKIVQAWGFDVEIIGLWVDENWQVSEI